MKFIPATQPATPVTEPVLSFLFNGAELAVTADKQIPSLDLSDPLLANAIYLGTFDDQHCYVAALPADTQHPAIDSVEDMRTLFGHFDEELYALSGFATQILSWRTNHGFCSKCGSSAAPHATERAMICTVCDFRNYPRISPCIIVAVTRGNELLMARSPHFAPDMYSMIAGFMEPGETLEECVAREVGEETNIQVKNIQYVTSQPWPFPHSIMVGFTADYAGGELEIDPHEIEDAGWYTADAMPVIPEQHTIARWLIDGYLAKHK